MGSHGPFLGRCRGDDEAGGGQQPYAGFSVMTEGRTWARRGHSPAAQGVGKGSGRNSVAVLVCCHGRDRGHAHYRLHLRHNCNGERRRLSEDDCAALITTAHRQLPAPIILIWDNVNTHISAAMRRFIDAYPAG